MTLVAATFGIAASSAQEKIPTTALKATESSEDGVVQEPDVWWDGRRWNMVYAVGWENAALAWATAERAVGPWVKRGVVLGRGVAEWGEPVSHHSVYTEGGMLYLYFPSQMRGEQGVLRVAVGRRLDRLRVLPDAVLTPPAEAGGTGPVNTSVIKDGDTYRMLFESKVVDPSWWNMGYATAASPTGPFTVQAFPLVSLQHGAGMYGGPDLHKTRHGFSLWYHAARDDDTTLPTDLFRATSTDLIHWATDDEPAWVHPNGYDQYADPVKARRGDRTWLFFSLMNNATPSGRIVVTRLP